MSNPSPRGGPIGAVSASVYAVRRALQWEPRKFWLVVVLTAAASVLPAAQVWVVVGASAAIIAGNTFGVISSVLVLGVIVGASRALTDATLSEGQVLTKILQARYQAEFFEASSRGPLKDVLDPQGMALAREVKDSLSRHVAGQADAALSSAKAFLTAALLFAAIIPLSAWAAVATVLALVPTLIAFSVVSRREAAVWPELAKDSARAEYLGAQLVYERSLTELTILGSAPVIGRMAAHRAQTYARRFTRMMRHSGLVIAASGLATSLFVVAAVWALVVSPAGGAAVAAAGIIGVLSGLAATADAGFTFGEAISGAVPVHRYRRFVSERSEVPPVALDGDPVESLTVQDLTVRYPGATDDAVRSISLRARRGEFIALVGVNGAGKTSLINAILGLVEHTGDVWFDGRSRDAREVCGVLSQDFSRFELTVRDNVALGRPDGRATEEEIWTALRNAGAAEFVEALPDGLDQQLGAQQGGVGLSGGQWQRLALARLYLRDSPVWILDEPTSAVDALEEQRVFELLRAQAESRITIVVSHRASTLRNVGRIYVMSDGAVVQAGSFAELQATPGDFARLFASQLTPIAAPDPSTEA